jgi:hypothetical protein
MTRFRKGLLLLASLACPASAFAEVADKVPSLGKLWTQSIVLALLAALVGAWRSWAALLPGLLGVGLLWLTRLDSQDVSFRGALEHELGSGYLRHSYLAASLPIVAMILVPIVRAAIRGRRRLPPNTSFERTREG